VTDPDRRNITDQRYADDAARRYLARHGARPPVPQWLRLLPRPLRLRPAVTLARRARHLGQRG
jgi:hypothetical protein